MLLAIKLCYSISNTLYLQNNKNFKDITKYPLKCREKLLFHNNYLILFLVYHIYYARARKNGVVIHWKKFFLYKNKTRVKSCSTRVFCSLFTCLELDGQLLGEAPLCALENAPRDNSLKLTAWERFRLSWYRTNKLGLYCPVFRSAG